MSPVADVSGGPLYDIATMPFRVLGPLISPQLATTNVAPKNASKLPAARAMFRLEIGGGVKVGLRSD